MAEDVRAGLGADPKDLSPWPKYFYDARGSELFEKITAQPEYGQTGAEAGILEDRAAEIVSRARCRELVELGSGSSSKTRTLLDAMTAREGPARYVPLNVSESALEGSARSLLEEYPEPRISGFVGDFEGSLGPLFGRLDGEPRTRLVVFLGGTIGNFTPQQRREFLDRLKAGLRGGDHVLVGVDLVKDASVIEAAYNDAAGVTEAFNKNLLHVLNRELGAGFDPGHFAHRAFYERRAGARGDVARLGGRAGGADLGPRYGRPLCGGRRGADRNQREVHAAVGGRDVRRGGPGAARTVCRPGWPVRPRVRPAIGRRCIVCGG